MDERHPDSEAKEQEAAPTTPPTVESEAPHNFGIRLKSSLWLRKRRKPEQPPPPTET
jgi:hypothetical protein